MNPIRDLVVRDVLTLLAGGAITVVVYVISKRLATAWRRWRERVAEDAQRKAMTELRLDWLEKECARQCKAINGLSDAHNKHVKAPCSHPDNPPNDQKETP